MNLLSVRVVLLMLLAGCQPPSLELFPARVPESAVVATEYRVEGIPQAELWRSAGPTLERAAPPEVWIGERRAEVVSVDPGAVRVRLRDALPVGQYALRVRAGSRYELSRALSVDEDDAFDGGLVADASSRDADGLDSGVADADLVDAASFDAGPVDGRDAEVRDATAPDGSVSDSGPPDASVSDAGGGPPSARGTCTGGSVGTRCVCAAGDVCTMTCDDDCVVICLPRSECMVTLHDDGALHCQAEARCKLEGHDRVEAHCGPGASCLSSFRNDGTVHCPPEDDRTICCIAACMSGCTGADECES